MTVPKFILVFLGSLGEIGGPDHGLSGQKGSLGNGGTTQRFGWAKKNFPLEIPAPAAKVRWKFASFERIQISRHGFIKYHC